MSRLYELPEIVDFLDRYKILLPRFDGKRRCYLAFLEASAEFSSKFGRQPFSGYGSFKAVLYRRPPPTLKVRGGDTHIRRAMYYGCRTEKIERALVFRRDGFVCHYCKCAVTIGGPDRKRWATIDHVIPLSKRGDHMYSNIVTACLKCNIDKGAGSYPKNIQNNGKSI